MVHTAPAGTPETGEQPPGGRSARKRQAIVEAATALFLEHGYQGTSMDDIAALAAVSKQTVYKNFADKQQLFSDIVLGAAARADAFIATLPRVLADTDDLAAGLRALARQYLAIVMQPRLLQMRRLMVAEAAGSPTWPAPITSGCPNTSWPAWPPSSAISRTAACCAPATPPWPPAITHSWCWACRWTGRCSSARSTACPPQNWTAMPTRPRGPSSPPTDSADHLPQPTAALTAGPPGQPVG